MIRLDKFLAEAGAGRRKEVRLNIKEGSVSVNHVIVKEPYILVNEDEDLICMHGEKVEYVKKVYYMFHKPAGCITARRDGTHATVMDYFPENEAAYIFPIGRLDKDTEGLLLFTNDGQLEHILMHPDHHVEKTYYFWSCGELTKSKKEQLISGVPLYGEEETAVALRVKVMKNAKLSQVYDQIPEVGVREKSFDKEQMVTCGTITIAEGRKHQVKRMLRAVDCRIIYLKRISIGELQLDPTLGKGRYRNLTPEELMLLMKSS